MKHHALILQRRRWHILKRSQTDLQTLYVKLPIESSKSPYPPWARQSEIRTYPPWTVVDLQNPANRTHITYNQTSVVLGITNLNWRNFLQIYGVITPLKPGSWSPSFFLRCCNGLSGDLRGSENRWKLMRMYTISNSIEVCQPSVFLLTKYGCFQK